MTAVLFICTGNICRSPLMEACFRQKVDALGVSDQFTIDSAGTDHWHIGEPPDGRMTSTARTRDVPMSGAARQVTQGDLNSFDLLICADASHAAKLIKMGADEDRVRLLLEWAPSGNHRDVPDPYYGGQEGFDLVFDLVDEATGMLLDRLLEQGT
jgi:protein-tyrosine phosphatase